MSVKKKIVQGGFYLAIANILAQILAIIVNIVLARLLMPEDFGLIALATTYIGFITIFTNIGFGSAIIHEQKSTQEQLSSIYWLNFFLSVSTFIIVALTTPFAANFYDEPELINVVCLASLNILLTPFFITHYKIKERDLEFKLLSKIALTGTTLGAVAATVGAFYGLGVYALVLQTLVSTSIRLVLILYYSRWKPSFIFRLNEIKGMIWYSIKYKASEGVLYFERNVDYLILGKLYSSAELGHYAFSYNIMYTPVKRISYIFNDILFPSFSAIKEDTQKIIRGYFQSVQLISLVSFPMMVLLAYNAEFVIPFVFGDHWNDAIPLVQILCFAGAVQSIGQTGGVIFASIGKPEINIYIAVARTILVIPAILIGASYSLLTVAYLIVIVKILSFFIMLAAIYFFIKFSVKDLFSYLVGPLTSVVVLTLIQGVFIYFDWSVIPFLKLLIMGLIALSITFIFHFAILKSLVVTILQKTTTPKSDE